MSEQKTDRVSIKDFGAIIPVASAKDYRHAVKNDEVLQAKIAMMAATGDGTEDEINRLRALSDEQKAQLEAFKKCINVYDSKYLSDNLIKLAEDCGLRISDLDDILGISNGYIARTLKPDSKKRLSIDVVANLATLFKVNVDDLINRPIFEPSPDMKLVIDFLGKLKERIDFGIDDWNEIGDFDPEYSALFMDSNENNLWYRFYSTFPDFYHELQDVYYTKMGNEGLYIVHHRPKEGTERYDVVRTTSKCYDIEGKIYPPEEIEDDFIKLICNTSNDPSGVLRQSVKSVVNAICTHSRDYRATKEAKDYMAAFIKGTDDSKRKSATALKGVGDE